MPGLMEWIGCLGLVWGLRVLGLVWLCSVSGTGFLSQLLLAVASVPRLRAMLSLFVH